MAQSSPLITMQSIESQAVLRKSTYLVLGACILIAGTWLRFYHLADRSLWYDEAVTANISRHSFQQMLHLTQGVSAPISHPFLLYLFEKVGSGAWMARLPSALSSLAAVMTMLVMTRKTVRPWAAIFAGAILSLSASQIRYAQEVREYSLAACFATVLIFCLLRYEEDDSPGHLIALCASLFVAPFVQYGLVLLSMAVLGTLLLRALLDRSIRSRVTPIVIAAAFSFAGDMFSYAVTLRYQLRAHHLGTQSYLAADYFDPRSTGVGHFVISNSWQVVSFFIPGQLVAAIVILGSTIVLVGQLRRGRVSTPALLLVTAFPITILASFWHVYPYGGIRQCLFLAPVLILFAGSVCADLLLVIRRPHQKAVAFAFLALIAVSGSRGILRQWPYGEFEDNQALLRELSRSSAPTDQVWVNHDAVDAFRFYLPKGDPRFTYGVYHVNPNDYMPDLFASISQHTTRLWLAFSHLEQPSDHAEEQLILKSLSSEWKVERRVSATNAELYLAVRTPVLTAIAGY